jgi:hypothetical protein
VRSTECLRRSVDFRTPEGARKHEQSSLAVEHVSTVPPRRLSRVPEEFYAYLERAIERMTPFQPFRSPDAEEFFEPPSRHSDLRPRHQGGPGKIYLPRWVAKGERSM